MARRVASHRRVDRSARDGSASHSSFRASALAMTSGACCSRSTKSRNAVSRSEEHTSELQSRLHLVCRLLLEKKKKKSRHERIATARRSYAQCSLDYSHNLTYL